MLNDAFVVILPLYTTAVDFKSNGHNAIFIHKPPKVIRYTITILYDHNMSVTVWVQSVLVCETFVELLEETRVTRPALRFQYYILPSVTKNLLALGIFKVHCQEGWENWWWEINKIILYSYCFFSSYFRSLSSIFNMLPTVKQDLSLYIFFRRSSLKSKIRASWISSRLWTKREPWKSPPLPSGRL